MIASAIPVTMGANGMMSLPGMVGCGTGEGVGVIRRDSRRNRSGGGAGVFIRLRSWAWGDVASMKKEAPLDEAPQLGEDNT